MAKKSNSAGSNAAIVLGATALVAGSFFTSWWLSSNRGPSAPKPHSDSTHQAAGGAGPSTGAEASLSKPLVVKSTENVENYTYLELMRDVDDTVWVAVPKMKVEVGERVVYADAMEMSDFHSRTLNRTFPTIYFARAAFVLGPDGKIVRTTGLDSSHSHPQAGLSANPHGGGNPHGGVAPSDVKSPKLDKPLGGLTIAEVYAKASELSGKPVKVRGAVVKATFDVLGVNWYHLRDGSADDKTGDLTITSKEKLQFGDVVVASGKLVTQKDLGANYVFEALIENAAIEKESPRALGEKPAPENPAPEKPAAKKPEKTPGPAAEQQPRDR